MVKSTAAIRYLKNPIVMGCAIEERILVDDQLAPQMNMAVRRRMYCFSESDTSATYWRHLRLDIKSGWRMSKFETVKLCMLQSGLRPNLLGSRELDR